MDPRPPAPLAQAAPPRPGEGVGQYWAVEQSTRAFVHFMIRTRTVPLHVTPCMLAPGGILRLIDTWEGPLAVYDPPRHLPTTPARPGWPWCPGEIVVAILPDMFGDRPHPRLYEPESDPRRPLLRLLAPKRK